jgi:glycosyltransferase involved in cell wall biosynthesis
MKISVVVPAFNEERLLGASLAAIQAAMSAFRERGWAPELIVCDNNSTDRTAQIARAAGATVVFEPINQISRARNRGAAAATGEWLIFVDADSQPSAALFDDVARAIEGGRCLAGGSTARFDRESRRLRWAIATWNAISRAGRWAAGSFIFCRAEVFRRVGGFSQELYAGEELELFRRLKRVARGERQSIVILSDHPLLTSARKMQLYDSREIVSFMVKTLLRGGRTLRSAEECFSWYDGRR